jgi:hypothetical protein
MTRCTVFNSAASNYHNYASGTGLMSGVVFGRLAGRNAAAWARG